MSTHDAGGTRTRTIHAVVSGQVQGVGFRWSCMDEAEGLGLVGSVHNTVDGDVVVEAQGDSGAVAQLIAWLFHGPRWASVSGVQVHDLPAGSLSATTFRVR